MSEKAFFEYSEKSFRVSGLWTGGPRKWNSPASYIMKSVVLFLTCGIMTYTMFSDAINEMKVGDFTGITSKCLYAMAYFCCCYKMFIAAFSEGQIYDVLRHLEKLAHTYKDTTKIDKALKMYRTLFVGGTSLIILCATFFFVAPLTTGRYHPLPFTPQISFMDIVKTPTWLSLFAYEFVAIYLSLLATMAYDTLFCGMMYLCSVLLNCTSKEISEFEDIIEDHQALEDAIKTVIYKIGKITYLTSTMSDIFSRTTMTHIIYNCNVMALGLYMAAMLSYTDLTCITMMMVTVLGTFQLGIYCYFGQIIVTERETLQQELYFTRWYDASKSFKTMLLLTIFEAQNERYVYAGKVVPLSYATFLEVVKKAYAFFTFLNEIH